MSENRNPWFDVEGKKIPETIELDPVIYQYIPPGVRILDIGSATGRVSACLAGHGFEVTGFDVNTDALKMTRASAHSHNCPFIPSLVRGTAIFLPFTDGSFNVAVMQAFLTVVELKEDRASIIREVFRILGPNGHIYIADFGQTWHSGIYRERYINDLPVTHEEGSFLVYDEKTGEFAYVAHHFTERELVFLLIDNGFTVEFFKRDIFVTRTGNRINGFVIVGRKL